MVFKIKLKNSKKTVLLDDFLDQNLYYKSLNILENFREHSSGCAVFQKSWRQTSGKYKTTTIYLHKLIAEKYIEKSNEENNLVIAKNANKLDCRVENLEWRDKAYIARRNPSSSETKHRGIRIEGKKFRTEIYIKGKRIPIGLFDSIEEAVSAYRKKSIELLGEEVQVVKNKNKQRMTSKRNNN